MIEEEGNGRETLTRHRNKLTLSENDLTVFNGLESTDVLVLLLLLSQLGCENSSCKSILAGRQNLGAGANSLCCTKYNKQSLTRQGCNNKRLLQVY